MVQAVYFESLKPGDQFEWRKGKLLRTKGLALMGRYDHLPNAGASSSFNCVDLESGEVHHVDGSELVIKIR